MTRKVKKHYWGWVIALVIAVLVLAMPLELFVKFVYETQQKAKITEELLVTLTGTAKTGLVFLSAIAALNDAPHSVVSPPQSRFLFSS